MCCEKWKGDGIERMLSKSYGKNGNRNGSDATQSSGFHNLRMPLVQHKNYLRLRENRNIWWSDLSLLSDPTAMWVSCARVAPHRQSKSHLNSAACSITRFPKAQGWIEVQWCPLSTTVRWHRARWDVQKGSSGREDWHTDHWRQLVMQHVVFSKLIKVPVPLLCSHKICPFSSMSCQQGCGYDSMMSVADLSPAQNRCMIPVYPCSGIKGSASAGSWVNVMVPLRTAGATYSSITHGLFNVSTSQ